MTRADFVPCVYILASQRLGRLYIGVTSNLMQRIYQHREDIFDGHSKDYGIKHLVWFESHDTMDAAIAKEKKLKRWNRQWKIELIEASNPGWNDLAVELEFEPLPFQNVTEI